MATAAVANERNNEKVVGNNASGVSCSIVPWAFQRFSVRFRVRKHVEAFVALVAMRTQLSNESGGRLATPPRSVTKEERGEESSNGGYESVLFSIMLITIGTIDIHYSLLPFKLQRLTHHILQLLSQYPFPPTLSSSPFSTHSVSHSDITLSQVILNGFTKSNSQSASITSLFIVHQFSLHSFLMISSTICCDAMQDWNRQTKGEVWLCFCNNWVDHQSTDMQRTTKLSSCQLRR